MCNLIIQKMTCRKNKSCRTSHISDTTHIMSYKSYKSPNLVKIGCKKLHKHPSLPQTSRQKPRFGDARHRSGPLPQGRAMGFTTWDFYTSKRWLSGISEPSTGMNQKVHFPDMEFCWFFFAGENRPVPYMDPFMGLVVGCCFCMSWLKKTYFTSSVKQRQKPSVTTSRMVVIVAWLLLETAVKHKVYEHVKCESFLFGCKDRAEEPDAQETVRSSLEEPWVGWTPKESHGYKLQKIWGPNFACNSCVWNHWQYTSCSNPCVADAVAWVFSSLFDFL